MSSFKPSSSLSKDSTLSCASLDAAQNALAHQAFGEEIT